MVTQTSWLEALRSRGWESDGSDAEEDRGVRWTSPRRKGGSDHPSLEGKRLQETQQNYQVCPSVKNRLAFSKICVPLLSCSGTKSWPKSDKIFRINSSRLVRTTHLSLREPDHVGQLCLPPDGDITAVVELLLQLQSLVVAVHDPVLVFCSRPSWKLQISLEWIRLGINHSSPPQISVAKHQDYIMFCRSWRCKFKTTQVLEFICPEYYRTGPPVESQC